MTDPKPSKLFSPFDVGEIKIIKDDIVYQGYARVHEVTLEHPTFGGENKLTVTREIFDSGNAVVVLPFDPKLNEVCLIEQLRMAPLMAGDHPTFGGENKLTVTREIFDSGNAVVVLPFDPALNEVCLIEQLRMAPLMAGDHPWLIEAIAGRIDDGTHAEAIARKEALEEANCALTDLINIGTFYQSPGIFAEEITYFIAKSDLSGVGGTHGLDTENEDIRALRLSLTEAFEALDTGQIRNAPTAFVLQHLRLRLQEIQSMWQS